MSMRDFFCNSVASRVSYPYIWGASGPDKFDCCGLVQWGMSEIGRPFGRDICSADLLVLFKDKIVQKGLEKVGSLFLYSTKNNPSKISHVTIFFRQWKNGKKFLIGANGGGSKTLTEDLALQYGAKVSIVGEEYRLSDLQFIVDPFSGE